MKKWSVVPAFLLLFLAGAYAQQGTAEGFLSFTDKVPTELVGASVRAKLVRVDSIEVGEFAGGAALGSAEMQAKIKTFARSQREGQVDFIRGCASSHRWDPSKPRRNDDYTNDVDVAEARANWAFDIERGEGAKARFLKPETSRRQAVVIIRATYERVKVVNAEGNHPPIITDFKVSPLKVPVGGSVYFQVKAVDQDKDSLRYLVVFGDGAKTTKPEGIHNFTKAGIYTIRCSVSDGHGVTDSWQVVQVGESGGGLPVTLIGGFGLSSFITEGMSSMVPAISLGIGSKDRHWLLVVNAGGWGVRKDSTWYDPTGKRALKIMNLEGTVFLGNNRKWGIAGGFQWNDLMVLETKRSTKSWYGPLVGVKYRWRNAAKSPISLLAGVDLSYSLHSEFGKTGSNWRFGIAPNLRILYTLGKEDSR